MVVMIRILKIMMMILKIMMMVCLQCLSILAHMCMKLTYTTPSAYHQLWALAEKVKVLVMIKMFKDDENMDGRDDDDIAPSTYHTLWVLVGILVLMDTNNHAHLEIVDMIYRFIDKDYTYDDKQQLTSNNKHSELRKVHENVLSCLI